MFQKIIKFILCTCSEYLWKVLVEIALYFELQKKKINLWLCIETIFLLEFLLYSSKHNIFFSKISTMYLECLYVCAYLISIFMESKEYVF
jgi:hypothetical protein